jgi:hypothetical protein
MEFGACEPAYLVARQVEVELAQCDGQLVKVDVAVAARREGAGRTAGVSAVW